jgi:hypothetical protein
LQHHQEIGAKSHRVKADVAKNYINYQMHWFADAIVIYYNNREVRTIKHPDFIESMIGAKMQVMFTLFLMPGQRYYPPVTQMMIENLEIKIF